MGGWKYDVSLSPSLLSGQVDAVIGAYRNFELNQLAIEGHAGRAFYVEEEGVPAYDELILVAHRDRLRDPRIDAFLIDLLEQADRAVLGLNRGHRDRMDDLRPQWEAAIAAWDTLLEDDVAAFNAVAGPAITAPAWD